jgi:hypothetical protein
LETAIGILFIVVIIIIVALIVYSIPIINKKCETEFDYQPFKLTNMALSLAPAIFIFIYILGILFEENSNIWLIVFGAALYILILIYIWHKTNILIALYSSVVLLIASMMIVFIVFHMFSQQNKKSKRR